jgi:hypothetical protein
MHQCLLCSKERLASSKLREGCPLTAPCRGDAAQCGSGLQGSHRCTRWTARADRWVRGRPGRWPVTSRWEIAMLWRVHGEETTWGMAGGGAWWRPRRGDSGLQTGIVGTPAEGGSSGMVAACSSLVKVGWESVVHSDRGGSARSFRPATSGAASDRGTVRTWRHLYRHACGKREPPTAATRASHMATRLLIGGPHMPAVFFSEFKTTQNQLPVREK